MVIYYLSAPSVPRPVAMSFAAHNLKVETVFPSVNIPEDNTHGLS